jgi:hypothetical protein
MRLGLRVSSSSKVLVKYITLFGELEEEIVCLVDMEAEGGYYRQSRYLPKRCPRTTPPPLS